MFKNRALDGRKNIAGVEIAKLRKALPTKPSQRAFAEMLQREGLDVDKNVIQQVESGDRFVTDIELKYFAKTLNVTCDQLVDVKMKRHWRSQK